MYCLNTYFYLFSSSFYCFSHSLRYFPLFFQCNHGKCIVTKAEKHGFDPVSSHHGDECMPSMHDAFYHWIGSLSWRSFSCDPEISPYLVHGCIDAPASCTCISFISVAWNFRYAEINLWIMKRDAVVTNTSPYTATSGMLWGHSREAGLEVLSLFNYH